MNGPPGGAVGLKFDPKGYWYASQELSLSYPEHGNDSYFAIEDESFWFRHRNNVISNLMHRFPPAGPVFDIGGGNGYVANGLETAGFSTVVVEPGRFGAENACRRGLRNVVNATIEAAQFAKGAVDAVGLFDVLEHIQDESTFLESVRQMMKPEGKIYLTVPAFQFLWSREDEFAGHYRRYTRRSLSRVLREAGFQVEFTSYFFCVLPLPVFLLRAIPSRFGRRGKPSTDREKQEHSSNGFARNVLDHILSAELTWLNAGRTIPLGGSCIAIAKLTGPDPVKA